MHWFARKTQVLFRFLLLQASSMAMGNPVYLEEQILSVGNCFVPLEANSQNQERRISFWKNQNIILSESTLGLPKYNTQHFVSIEVGLSDSRMKGLLKNSS